MEYTMSKMAKQQTEEVDFFAALKIVQDGAPAKQDELVNKAKELIGQANQLSRYTGKSFVVINHEEQAKPAVKRPGRPQGATKKAETTKGSFKYNEALHCKVCDVKGHDGRAHKFHPDKFTPEELEAAKPQTAEATA